MAHKTFLATTAVAALIGSGAMAASVSIDQIGAIWQNPVFDQAVVANTIVNGDGSQLTGGETVSIFWGDAATNAGQSGYEFNPTDVSFLVAENAPAILGRFTHFNQPIFASGGSLTSVELLFQFAGSPEGTSLTAMFPAIFDFGHDETPNTSNNGIPLPVGACDPVNLGTTAPCPDVVTVSAEGGADETVIVDNLAYTFTLLGFSPDAGATFSNIFVTEEGQPNSADLYFKFSVTPVPLPAAGWLLLAGIGGLAAMGRRRKMV